MKIAAIAALLSFVIASAAQAATVRATWTGTISAGYDGTGEFGAPATFLQGEAFELVFDYDPAVGTRTTTTNSDYVEGGDFFGTASPSLSANLTIDGVKKTIAGFYRTSFFAGVDFTTTDKYYDEAIDYVNTTGAFRQNRFYALVQESGLISIPDSLDVPFNLTIPAGVYREGSFGFDECLGTTLICEGGRVYAYGSFNFTTLTLARISDPTTPVPLPASGLMLMAGAGLLAAARLLRRRG